MPDHDDAEAEHTLAALGGDVPECIRIREAWESWAGDPALITLGRRPGEAALGFAADDGHPVAAALHTPPLRRRPGEPARRDALFSLLSLPLPLVDRLVLTSLATAASAWSDASFRERHGLRIGTALAARARPAFERLGDQLARPGETIVHVAPAPLPGRLEVRAERTSRGIEVTAVVPLAWLVSVWGAGLSEPDGQVVGGLRGATTGGYEVDVIEWAADGEGRWTGAVRSAVAVRGAGGDWRVELLGS